MNNPARTAFGLYVDIESNLHELDARIKLPAAFALIVLIGALPQGAWPVLLFLFMTILGLQIASEIPFTVLYSRSLIAIPFLLAALPILFTTDGIVFAEFEFLKMPMTISIAGIERFVHILLKSWFSVHIAILLAATTQMMDLLNAMRVYRAPKMIVMIFRLMWRYLSIMVNKAQRMMRARAARSVNINGHHKSRINHTVWQAKVTGSMAGSLFVQSLEQSERVYFAMLSRGFDGEIRLMPQPELEVRQKVIIVFWILFCLFLLMIGYLFG
ncbi:MAG: cobalt ECF transporter T component CbiQ [Anaerolineaceae bacterium]|nr:cobalt ECF transporter T component CbiQ [Anaerolineaceae bacterium]